MEKYNYDKSVKIRPANKEDIKTIAEIECLCFPEAEAASFEIFQQRYQTFPENFLVAIKEEKIVGFINGNTCQSEILYDEFYSDMSHHDKEGDYMSVFGIDVLPAYQHQRIAHQLMNSYMELARKRGKKGIILTCKDRLISFYESFGYHHLGVSASTHGHAKWNDMIWRNDSCK